MKIALLTDGIFPYAIGGMQKHSFYLTKYFAQKQIQVDLFHLNNSKYDINKLEFFTEEEKKYIRSIVLKFPKTLKFPGHYIYESYLYSKLIYAELSYSIDQYEYIYVQGFTGWSLIQKKKKGRKIPLIAVNFHGLNMFQLSVGWSSTFYNFLFRKAVLENVKYADVVFSFAGKIHEIYLKLGINQEKLIISHNGIAENWLEKSIKTSAPRRLVYVGRYERIKGIEELTEVLSSLSEKYNFECYFVGNIPHELQLNLKNIKYLGVIGNEVELKKIYQSCDVLVIPSYSEGMPTVILEAMAQSLTVIATDVGANSIMVNSMNGWLIPPLNKDALKLAIISSLSISEEEMSKKKALAYELVRTSFTWNTIIKSLIKDMEEALKKRIKLNSNEIQNQ